MVSSIEWIARAHLFNPRSSKRLLTAPRLVHTSPPSTPNPICCNRVHRSAFDSLLVLLQKRNGILAARSFRSAAIAPGVGSEPMWRVPERSIRRAAIGGREQAISNRINLETPELGIRQFVMFHSPLIQICYYRYSIVRVIYLLLDCWASPFVLRRFPIHKRLDQRVFDG